MQFPGRCNGYVLHENNFLAFQFVIHAHDPSAVPPIRDTDQPIIAQENRTTLQEGPDSSTLLM